MANPGGTAVVDYNSDLVRKRWIQEGLIKFKDKSFWQSYIGRTINSIIYQQTNPNAKEGHTVVFDFDGEIVAGPVRGKEQALGKGETKRKFSDKITVDRFRFTVDNGDAFDGVNIGDLSITQHQDSRMKLARKWTRFKDQGYFDTAQHSATHIIDAGSTFDLSSLLDIENTIKTGNGYSVGGKRLPLMPFETSNGQPVWIIVIDSPIKTKFLKDSGSQNLLAQADLRGNENRLFKGILGKIGNFLIIEADSFFGTQLGPIMDSDNYFDYSAIGELLTSGMRQYKEEADGTKIWTGEKGFDSSNGTLYSRAVILGAGAMQHAWGKMPDYKVQESPDFGIKSESLLELWTGLKATVLKAENDDYAVNIGGISYGIVAVDVQI